MNRQCPYCGGWELQDGTEDADWNQCECDEEEQAKRVTQGNYLLSVERDHGNIAREALAAFKEKTK